MTAVVQDQAGVSGVPSALRGRSRAAAPRSAPSARWRTGAAEAAGLTVILVAALALRLVGLGDPTDVSDEGIRGIQLRLLAAGFTPVSEIYASQGPLALWLFYPLVALLGPDIVVGRLTAVLASLLAVVGGYLVARQAAGRTAGLLAALVAALSPVFLEASRLAFVEIPSIAPAALGLASLLRFRSNGRRRWLVLAAVLLAAGALAKPMAATAGLPALLVLLLPGEAGPSDRPWRGRLADLALFAAVGLGACLLVVLAIGPAVLYEQIVAYRLGARAAHGWDVAANAALLADGLERHGWGLLLAVGVGIVRVTARHSGAGLATVAWLLGGLAVLLVYSPLWPKHVTYLVLPLAVLAGAGIASIGGLLRRPRTPLVTGLGLAGGLAVALTGLALPSLAADVRSVVYRHAGQDLSRYADDLRIVEAATAPRDFVVIDDAYLAMLTGRLVPPSLADLSWNRILARALTVEQAIAATRERQARVLIVQDAHLGLLQGYVAWADREYVLVKAYVQRRPARFRRVYVHPDVELAPVREALVASLSVRTDVTIGPVALLGYELERRDVKAGSRVGLTVLFEAREDRPPEHALVLRLRDAAGHAVQESAWKVGEGAQELHTWPAGRWQAQAVRPLVDTPPGTYTLTLALERPREGPVAVTARSGARVWGGGAELDLGEVTVLR